MALNALNLKNFEMSTYTRIQEYVKSKYGFEPKTCWIAHAKELCRIPVKKSWNRAEEERKNPCPSDKLPAIRDAFEYFGML